MIRYVPSNRSPILFMNEERLPRADLYIAPETYRRRQELAEERFSHMIAYAANETECRSTVLERYFGAADPAPCGVCDICLAAHKRAKSAEAPLDEEILRQLDAAARRWSDEPSLSDYRPEARLAEDELQALRSARLIVTPHHAVAQWARQHLRAEVHELPWQLPALPGPCAATPASGNPRQLSLALACSALARKGWRELCEALHGIAAMAQGLSSCG